MKTLIMIFCTILLSGCSTQEVAAPKIDSQRYTAYGRYYTDGTVITNDGHEWGYSTDTISNLSVYDGMPVWIGFDDNGTPNEVTDDIILGLVYDRNTAIYDDLETALSDKFELERDGNNIAIIDRVEDGIATVEVCNNEMVNIPATEFNMPKTEGERLEISKTIGSLERFDGGQCYQFKSYDDTVWWCLSAEELGFVPEANKTYTLIYYNNGTTDCTECPEEFDCECEVYDDIFLAIK